MAGSIHHGGWGAMTTEALGGAARQDQGLSHREGEKGAHRRNIRRQAP